MAKHLDIARGIAFALILVATFSLGVSARTALEISRSLRAIDARIAATFNPEPCR